MPVYSIVSTVKSWVRSTISTEEEEEEEAISTEKEEEKGEEEGAISMTGRFSSMQVELQEANDRKSQWNYNLWILNLSLGGKGMLTGEWISEGISYFLCIRSS